ncbi:MAG: haloacid dehalogenase type II [Burkholderiales bacterium]
MIASPRRNLKALVFDAYGTLFDVHSVVRLCDQLWPGKGTAISQLWRTKQLEYTWQRSLMRRYEDFESVTVDGLRYACTALGVSLSESRVARLQKAYLSLATFPEVKDALGRLSHLQLAILSNGAPSMLDPVVANAGLDGVFSAVISVDPLKTYKPTPEVYRLAVKNLGMPKNKIGFVSSNCWDACGAKSFGFRTFWINRSDAPVDRLDAAPDHIIRNLADLPGLV